MGSLSLTHILVLVILFIIFFRPQKVGQLGKAIRKSISNYKDAKNEIEAEVISEEKKSGDSKK